MNLYIDNCIYRVPHQGFYLRGIAVRNADNGHFVRWFYFSSTQKNSHQAAISEAREYIHTLSKKHPDDIGDCPCWNCQHANDDF